MLHAPAGRLGRQHRSSAGHCSLMSYPRSNFASVAQHEAPDYPQLGYLVAYYPRIPVMVIPRINVFWVKKKRTTIGRIKSTDAAIKKPACRPWVDLYSSKPTESVYQLVSFR